MFYLRYCPIAIALFCSGKSPWHAAVRNHHDIAKPFAGSYHSLKSSFSLSSFSSEPITHRRPVYSGAPSRTSASSGTMSK